jgi:hypothetical protein
MINRTALRRLACAAVLFLASGGAQAADYFVSPAGDDAHNGSIDHPFRTVSHAVSVMKPGDTCYIREGRYHEHVVLDSLKGSREAPYAFLAYQDEEVTFDGSVPIDAVWRKYRGNIYHTQLTAPVWQLFVNGKSMTSARWPNGNWDDGSLWDKKKSMMWPQGGELKYEHTAKTRAMTQGAGTGHYVNEQLKELEFSLADGGILVVTSGSFRTYKSFIQAHEPGSDRFQFDAGTVMVHFSYKDRVERHGYFLEGKKELIDVESEWFYEPKTGMLYLWAEDGADPSGLEVRGKVQSYAFKGRDCSHVKIQGIDFFGTTVDFGNCNNVTIEDGDFLYPSYSRRMLRDLSPIEVTRLLLKDKSGPAHNVIRNNRFGYMDGPALELNGAGNLVENNYMHHVDYSCTYAGGYTLNMINTVELTFRRNTIHTTGASETFKAGVRNTIELNDISKTGFLQNDGSTVQVSVAAQDRSFTRYNWVHDTVKQGLRFDNSNIPDSPYGENGTMHHNVAWATDRIFFKGDKHFIFNNLVFDSARNDLIISANVAIQGRNYETISRNNICNKFSGHRTEPGSKHPVPGIVDHNWAGNFKGADIRSQLRDPDNLDFRPRADSELIDAGIPVEGRPVAFLGKAPDIGPYEYGDENYWIPGFQDTVASQPVPPSGSSTVKADADLMWLGAYRSDRFDVYFGAGPDQLSRVSTQSNNIFDPGALEPGKTYYWRIDSRTPHGLAEGPVWSFTVGREE